MSLIAFPIPIAKKPAKSYLRQSSSCVSILRDGKEACGRKHEEGCGQRKGPTLFPMALRLISTDHLYRKPKQPTKKQPLRTQRRPQRRTANGPRVRSPMLRSPTLLYFQNCAVPKYINREEAEAKKAEAARKKAEKDALLAQEEKDARAAPKNAKTAVKKTRGLDLTQLDEPSTSKAKPALNATGIDNALDALSLTSNNPSEKIDRHPERRFKAAYAAYEARRMPEVEEEHKGLRKNQRIELIRKEFERSPENPFNQANARFDSTREEIKEIKEQEKDKMEARLVER